MEHDVENARIAAQTPLNDVVAGFIIIFWFTLVARWFTEREVLCSNPGLRADGPVPVYLPSLC